MPVYVYRVVRDASDPGLEETFEIRQLMSDAPLTKHPRTGEPVERALSAMRAGHVRRLPVVDSAGSVVGIISLTDIIRYAALPEAEVMAAVAQICEPHRLTERTQPQNVVVATE